jgi:hypothetical protein
MIISNDSGYALTLYNLPRLYLYTGKTFLFVDIKTDDKEGKFKNKTPTST